MIAASFYHIPSYIHFPFPILYEFLNALSEKYLDCVLYNNGLKMVKLNQENEGQNYYLQSLNL